MVYAKPIIGITACLSIALFYPANVSAQNAKTEVRAQVGEFTLNISGYASKNAAVILDSNKQTLGSTIADSDGKFSYKDLPIQRGFTFMCFRQIDLKSLGQSYSCLSIPPATGNVVLKDIYLPPTLGLERSTITIGSSGLAYGYSMPQSSVTMKLSSGTTYKEKADGRGYYSFTIPNLQQGSYELSSQGFYNQQESLKPEQKVTLKVLTSSAQVTNEGVLLRNQLQQNLPWMILSGILLIPLLIWMLYKLRPEWFSLIVKSKLFISLRRLKKRKLHHSWFIGY